VDPDVHVGQVSTLASRTEMSYQRERLLAALLEFAGVLALLLSAIGVYGLVSFYVSRRTREIGIRMALGARPGEIVAWAMRGGLIATSIGLGIGGLAAWQAARWLTGFLYGVGPADATTYVAVSGVLGAMTLVAGLLAAYRAARLDPALALRDP
jgi:ABC-type antimicrobial peptide transport system permease subunit